MEKIWIMKIPNKEVLKRVRKEVSNGVNIWKFMGEIIDRKIEGKRSRRSPSVTYSKQIKKNIKVSSYKQGMRSCL